LEDESDLNEVTKIRRDCLDLVGRHHGDTFDIYHLVNIGHWSVCGQYAVLSWHAAIVLI